MTIVPVNYAQKRTTVDGLLRKWGGPAALLRKDGSFRPCIAMITEYSPEERRGQMIDPTYRKALISALSPDGSVLEAPSKELDVLVTYVPGTDPQVELERVKIMAPPTKLSPTGLIVYWKLSVRN